MPKRPAQALRWVGPDDRYLVGVPARDLDEHDLAVLAPDEEERAVLIARCIASGLYRPADLKEHPDG